jgi:hypothetical protein
MNCCIFFVSGPGGSQVAGGWLEAGKLVRLSAHLDAGTMRVAVGTDSACAGGENS